MRKSVFALLAALLCLSACAPMPADSADKLTVYALKCGKADAFVLTCGGRTLVLDTGETDDADKILSLLEGLEIGKVDVLLLSHYDKDHVGGAAQLLAGVEVTEVIEPTYEEKSDEVKAYRLSLQQKGLTARRPDGPVTFNLGSAQVKVYPTALENPGDNDVSLIVTLTHGDLTFLFPGDAEEARLREWLADHDEAYTFLKAPHHGRWNDATQDFYTTVQPEICVVTTSEKNPADERTLALLNRLNAKTYLTQNGTVTLVSDGKTLNAGQ